MKNIINKKGCIFMAVLNNLAVGCFALLYVTDTCYELGKIAVHSKYQGLPIGQKFLTYTIDFAKLNEWDKIILYSNTKLPTAVYIYKKIWVWRS